MASEWSVRPSALLGLSGAQLSVPQRPDWFWSDDREWIDYCCDAAGIDAFRLDEACMSWGRYIETEMYEATLEDEAEKVYFKNKGIREQVLRRILGEGTVDGFRRRPVKTEDVPFRVRAPMADDPDDPLGLYDRSDPFPAPKGRYKDPQALWDRLNG